MFRSWGPRLFAAMLATLMARPALAQESDRMADIQRRIASLETQLAELKALVAQTSAAPPVETPPADAAPAQQPPVDDLHGLKVGAALDTYYGYNFNHPIGRVNLLRAYDVTSNNFTLDQANAILDWAPEVDTGRRFGMRVDFQFGQATETLQGSLANEPRPWVYRNVFQAYGTYIVPLGRGLTVDFGKWASSLGVEGNYAKDQINCSRSLWFDFLPFYHMGARVNYPLTSAVAVEYWATNGTEQTEAFNNFKDQSVGVVLTPTKTVTWNARYYLGQEHPDVVPVETPGPPSLPTQPGLSVTPIVPYYTGKLHIVDTYATWQATPLTSFTIEGDYVVNRNQAPTPDARVYGGAAYARRQLTMHTAIAARAEYLRDEGGFFTGITQSIKEATVTYDFHPGPEGFLIRAEWRGDYSGTPFFLTDTAGQLKTDQQTATVGIVWWWGTKRGAW